MAELTTVIPVYNGEKFISETLECLAAQRARPDRVVVLDDSSTDRTPEIVRNFATICCDLIKNEQDRGLFANHNRALRLAPETEHLHILHANDTVGPEFYSKLLPLLKNASAFAMAYSDHVFIWEDGTPLKQVVETHAPARRLSLGGFLKDQSELKSIQLHSALMKTGHREIPVQFRLDLPQLGDVVFHSQFAPLCSEIWSHPDVLSFVRIHQDSATNKNIHKLQAWVLDEWKTMEIVLSLMKEKGLPTWQQRQKLKLLFAARCHVKTKSIQARDPAYARNIREAVIPITGQLYWRMAGIVVALRDTIKKPTNFTTERLNAPKQPA